MLACFSSLRIYYYLPSAAYEKGLAGAVVGRPDMREVGSMLSVQPTLMHNAQPTLMHMLYLMASTSKFFLAPVFLCITLGPLGSAPDSS
jgi:hypothetical protein